jgi:hypothetical protein
MAEMPTEERILALKSQFPDRVLKLIEAVDGKDGDEVVLNLVMTGPTRDEYNFYVEKMIKAKETKDEGDRVKAMRAAVEIAALAQIRWPDREAVKKEFEARPQMIDSFASTLDQLSGGQIELRAKNL